MRYVEVKRAESRAVFLFLALALLALPVSAGGQKNKDKKKNVSTSDSAAMPLSLPPLSDSQAVDQTIGEALGYWQLGDVESLHKYYSDDVVVVSSLWEPPVIGWANYAKAYQAQRAQVTGARLDRSNTVIKVNGNSAWAAYQFAYAAVVDNKVVQFRGHTTLVLAKQADRWVITLDHSSVVDSSVPSPATPSAPTESMQSSQP